MWKEKLEADSAGAVVERVRRGGDRSETSCGTEWTCETSWLFGMYDEDATMGNDNGGESGVFFLDCEGGVHFALLIVLLRYGRGGKRESEGRRSQEAGGPPEGGAQQSCQVISRCDGFIDVGGASKSPRSNWVDNPIFRFRPAPRVSGCDTNLLRSVPLLAAGSESSIIQAVTSSYISNSRSKKRLQNTFLLLNNVY